MATAEFVHLHGHSEYSLLDGGCHLDRMAAFAAERGMPALALTDHGNLFGAVSHYNACADAGIKPIIGCEVYVSIGSRHVRKAARGLKHASNHLVLLVKNQTGYKNLIKLVSKGYLEGYYYNPRIDKELLREYSEGLICLSGCIGGEVAHLIQHEGMAAAEEAAREYMDIFGDDYYLEIQRHDIDVEEKINDGLLRLHKRLDVPLVATNDFHFLHADDHTAHDALVCIQTGKMVSDDKRMCYPKGLYMKSPAEMQRLFSDLPQAIEITVAIAEKCHVEIETGQLIYPNFPLPDDHPDALLYLTELAEEGLHRRFGSGDAERKQRLDYELSIIHETGFVQYFLIVWDYVHFARQNGITVGPGRGSGAGSLVAYSLGITNTDPIKHDLLFERMLNPERVSPPDFDIDFADRDRVVDYVVQKYGEANVCQIITFGTMGAKAVIRDVGRVLGMPYGEIDAIAKLVPTELKITLEKAIERVPELKEMSEAADDRRTLIDHALRLEGLARHASVHAAGVIIAPSDLTDYMPVYKTPKDGKVTTQWDGSTCEALGFMKMDFLGLNELNLMDEAVRLIRVKDPDFDIEAVPWDDEATFALFGRGETIGVFQFASAGMREYLTQLKPDKVSDIIAMNALYRPGPMEKIPNYIARKHGDEEIACDHPLQEPILEETYGVIVYQEQVLQIAQKMAGFTLGSADILRRAMGKKKPEEMAAQKKSFVDGCVDNDVDRKTAEKVFTEIEVFSGYGFNKCHSAPYAELAYKNAYLKANHPGEYMAASLSTSMSNTDTVTVLLDECRRMEIPVLPPNVAESAVLFTPTPDGIRFGLAAVKNVGAGAAQAIVECRQEGDPFDTLFDLCERLDARAVNRRTLESLIAAGGLDGLPGHRAQKLEGLDLALKNAQVVQEERGRGQFNLFEQAGNTTDPAIEQLSLPEVEEWSETELLAQERELLGFYVTSHPLSRYAQDLRFFAQPLSEIDNRRDGETVRVGGLVDRVSTSTDRRGQPIAFITLEDLSGSADVVFFSDACAQNRHLIEPDQAILIEGRLSRRNGSMGLQAESALPLSEAREKLTKALHVSLPLETIEAAILERLRCLCVEHSGKSELLIHLRNGGDRDAVVRSRSILVNPCDELLAEVDRLIEPERSWLTAVSPVPQTTRS
jgi:DNA polymerase-3 subunit alpha